MATNITARLSSLRKEKGLSQKEAAAGLGVSQALLSHYENGADSRARSASKATCPPTRSSTH